MLNPIPLEPMTENSLCSVYVGLHWDAAMELAAVTYENLVHPDWVKYYRDGSISPYSVFVALDNDGIITAASRGKKIQEGGHNGERS